MGDLYIGLMSGTSVDAVDSVLVEFDEHGPSILKTRAEKFPAHLQTRLHDLIQQQQTRLKDLAELDHEIAVIYTLAVKKLLQLANISASKVTAIGAHGQTIFHHPDGKHPNSLQIGDPSFLAEHTGIDVVADFRRHDMAAGGQGAPLAPAFHAYVFRDPQINRVILNLGGIANVTILPASEDKSVRGFDTGPANTLLDLWASRHLENDYDENGQWSKSGSVNIELLKLMLDDEYFARTPPKSTGREYFNLAWLENFNLADHAAEDIQATLCALTARSIARAVNDYANESTELYACGGGVHNTFLMQQLEQALPGIKVTSTEALGLSPDWIEAAAFAWLARQTISNATGNIVSVTGAKRAVPLGGIYRAG
jgi:anhydro-N-acetylmuramic acid kinase